jgi:hypothetical protein
MHHGVRTYSAEGGPLRILVNTNGENKPSKAELCILVIRELRKTTGGRVSQSWMVFVENDGSASSPKQMHKSANRLISDPLHEMKGIANDDRDFEITRNEPTVVRDLRRPSVSKFIAHTVERGMSIECESGHHKTELLDERLFEIEEQLHNFGRRLSVRREHRMNDRTWEVGMYRLNLEGEKSRGGLVPVPLTDETNAPGSDTNCTKKSELSSLSVSLRRSTWPFS